MDRGGAQGPIYYLFWVAWGGTLAAWLGDTLLPGDLLPYTVHTFFAWCLIGAAFKLWMVTAETAAYSRSRRQDP